ncbi:MAG: c-type cytochrome [Bryobacteraceae bacterium]
MGLAFGIVLLASVAAAQSDSVLGRKLYEAQCSLCHGQSGTGGRGPSLNRPVLNKAPDDAALSKVISKGIPPEMPAAWQLSAREVASVAAHVRTLGTVPLEAPSGDRARGEKLYAAKGCAGCHIVAGQGEALGPELTNVGARRNLAWLRQAILNPAETLPEDFYYMAIVTASGRAIRGIRLNEDSFSIQIKDVERRFHSFRKSELKEWRRLPKETPMPSYGSVLSAAEVEDIVAYLASLRGVS